MIHEKIFILAVDREAKIILKGKHDKFFRSPIGINHPKYWKLQSLKPEKAQLMQLVYSGVSKKQLDTAIKEFKQFFGPGYVFSDTINIDERLKTLKGIKLTDINRRLLMSA
jgi:hypothetical protein